MSTATSKKPSPRIAQEQPEAAGPKKPSHRVYAVVKRGEKSIWTEIGAVWAHGDAKGFNLKLNFLPVGEAELVIREPKPAETGNES